MCPVLSISRACYVCFIMYLPLLVKDDKMGKKEGRQERRGGGQLVELERKHKENVTQSYYLTFRHFYNVFDKNIFNNFPIQLVHFVRHSL